MLARSSRATDQRAGFLNWDEVRDMRNSLGERQSVNERIMLRELLRRADMMMYEKRRAHLLHTPWPPGCIGGAGQGFRTTLATESLSGPNAGLTWNPRSAGCVTEVYDPVYEPLSPDRKQYLHEKSNRATIVPAPGTPFSLVLRAEPGKEDVLLHIASEYEAASKRRIPPPALGRIPQKD